MATNMLDTLLRAAMYLEEEEDKLSQSQFSSSPTTTSSSTASSPSTSSPTVFNRPPSLGRHSGSPVTASWSVKMSSASPTMVTPVSGGGLSPQNLGNGAGGRGRSSLDASHVVSTNQSQYPTAKAVSLSVANLPQQTAAIPLIIGQHQGPGLATVGTGGSASGVSISASTKYGLQPPPTATLLNSINQAVLGPGNGIQLATPGVGSGMSAAGITRILHNGSGNILQLPSGTAAAPVNNGSGAGATTFSTLVRVNRNGSVDNITEEQFENGGLPPSLVVISPQNFATGHQLPPGSAAALTSSTSSAHHGQTISIIPAPSGIRDLSSNGSSGSSSVGTTGLDLSQVDFVHSTSGAGVGVAALSSNDKPTNTFEVTTTNLSKKSLANQPASVFVNRKSYPGLDLAQTAPPPSLAARGTANNVQLPPPPSSSAASTIESIMKSTNLVSGNGKAPQPLLANGLMGASVGGALHFQHTLPLTAADKPEDLSSHLTFNLSTSNGYPVGGGESVNNLLSKTTGTTTLVGAAPGKPIINLRDLSIDPQQLQEMQQQQQSLYQAVYQKGVLTPASATSSGRRRTTSNNSTGGSQRSPSSMRSGTRESHNKLEKNRRAQMRSCFETLKKHLPKGQEEKKTSNLSILSSAYAYINTLKRTDKEGEHELERLAKEKIALQSKLNSLKRELAPHLDKDPELASLVLVSGDVSRSVRTSESGADEASSMDGYPSNVEEGESFRGPAATPLNNLVDRSLSPLVTMNGTKVQMLGDQVSVELKSRDSGSLTISSAPTSGQSTATILAVPNLSQVNLPPTSSQFPLTAINLSATANPNNHNLAKNGLLNIPSSVVGPSGSIQQIISSSPSSFVHSISNGQHVIMKGATGPLTSNNNGFTKSNGLIIRETTASPGTTTIAEKIGKFGSNGELLEPSPAKLMKLSNGTDLTMTATTLPAQHHTQVLPIYKSTQNGGLRMIGHHTTTTTSAPNGSTLSAPSVVFSNDASSKYPQHLASGMVINGALPASLSHQYLPTSINGTAITTAAGGAQVHKLLLTGMAPSMTAQAVSTAYTLPQISQNPSGDIFARGTSLPGGAQLNVCRSPSTTPSPTISLTATPKGNGNGLKKGGRGQGAQISSVPTVNGVGGTTTTMAGMPQIVSKVVVDTNWNAHAGQHVPFQMVTTTTTPTLPSTATIVPVMVAEAKTTGPTKGRKQANGGGGRGSKRKNAAAAAQIPATTLMNMEPVKNSPPLIGKGFHQTTTSDAPPSGGGGGGKLGSISLTNTKPTTTIKQ